LRRTALKFRGREGLRYGSEHGALALYFEAAVGVGRSAWGSPVADAFLIVRSIELHCIFLGGCAAHQHATGSQDCKERPHPPCTFAGRPNECIPCPSAYQLSRSRLASLASSEHEGARAQLDRLAEAPAAPAKNRRADETDGDDNQHDNHVQPYAKPLQKRRPRSPKERGATGPRDEELF
jgi:hypothetical protein